MENKIFGVEPKAVLHIFNGFQIKCYRKPPNKFHRFMQKIAFGFKWEIIEKE